MTAYSMACGCSWTIPEPDEPRDLATFTFCAMHEAAPNLLRAVEQAWAALHWRVLVPNRDQGATEADAFALKRFLEAALKQAEGGQS